MMEPEISAARLVLKQQVKAVEITTTKAMGLFICGLLGLVFNAHGLIDMSIIGKSVYSCFQFLTV